MIINGQVAFMDINAGKSWIIVRNSPNGYIRVSGVFYHKENAEKELAKRLTHYNNRTEQQIEHDNKYLEGWSEPKLMELSITNTVKGEK